VGVNDTRTTSVGDKQVFLDVVDIEGGSSDNNSETENNIPSSQEDMKLFLDQEGDTSALKNTSSSTSGIKLVNYLILIVMYFFVNVFLSCIPLNHLCASVNYQQYHLVIVQLL